MVDQQVSRFSTDELTHSLSIIPETSKKKNSNSLPLSTTGYRVTNVFVVNVFVKIEKLYVP